MIFQVVILILWGSDSYFFVIFSRVLILIISGSDWAPLDYEIPDIQLGN